VKDGNRKKGFEKRQANKKARKHWPTNGSMYKKYYNNWKICDYRNSLYWIRKKGGIPVYHFYSWKEKRMVTELYTLEEIRWYWSK
jgi:hypothetical protein